MARGHWGAMAWGLMFRWQRGSARRPGGLPIHSYFCTALCADTPPPPAAPGHPSLPFPFCVLSMLVGPPHAVWSAVLCVLCCARTEGGPHGPQMGVGGSDMRVHYQAHTEPPISPDIYEG